MRQSVSQLILDFEPAVGSRDEAVTLLIFHSEQGYFEAKTFEVPKYKVELPRPFQATALMDSGGWRQTPRHGALAGSLGQLMWLNLPQDVRNSILGDSRSTPQRVAIMSTGCGLDDVPWEWLTDDYNQPIATRNDVRFVRVVPARYASPALKVAPPVKVLIVLTNPKDERLLKSDVEISIITGSLNQNQDYDYKVLMEPRLNKFKKELDIFEPHIVHYVGHSGISGSMGNLILHDEVSGTRWVSAAEFARLLPSSVRLLCLSTCITAQNYQVGGLAKFAHSTPETQLPTTIANQYALDEDAARTFWGRFYPALIEFKGNAVEALHNARVAVFEKTNDFWGWASFSIVVRDGSGHPMQIDNAIQKPTERNAELEAQWSARLANTIATRMRSLNVEAQKHWQPTLEDEVKRAESLESKLES